VRVQGRKATGGFEVKYHKADADFDADDDEFAGSRIDLGGWSYQADGRLPVLRGQVGPGRPVGQVGPHLTHPTSPDRGGRGP
jgi:hypothetical protein